MVDLRGGTVTFLVTDFERSTERWATWAAMAAAVDRDIEQNRVYPRSSL
jgi:hypothetical protein